jgi:hypothetical protein
MVREFLTLFSPCITKASLAGLQREIPIAIHADTEYTQKNVTAITELWQKLSGDPGVVALPDSFVEEKHLPRAMRFPWDETRGVYLLAGFHNLHCLVRLRRAETHLLTSTTIRRLTRCVAHIIPLHLLHGPRAPATHRLLSRFTLSGPAAPGCYLQC